MVSTRHEEHEARRSRRIARFGRPAQRNRDKSLTPEHGHETRHADHLHHLADALTSVHSIARMRLHRGRSRSAAQEEQSANAQDDTSEETEEEDSGPFPDDEAPIDDGAQLDPSMDSADSRGLSVPLQRMLRRFQSRVVVDRHALLFALVFFVGILFGTLLVAPIFAPVTAPSTYEPASTGSDSVPTPIEVQSIVEAVVAEEAARLASLVGAHDARVAHIVNDLNDTDVLLHKLRTVVERAHSRDTDEALVSQIAGLLEEARGVASEVKAVASAESEGASHATLDSGPENIVPINGVTLTEVRSMIEAATKTVRSRVEEAERIAGELAASVSALESTQEERQYEATAMIQQEAAVIATRAEELRNASSALKAELDQVAYVRAAFEEGERSFNELSALKESLIRDVERAVELKESFAVAIEDFETRSSLPSQEDAHKFIDSVIAATSNLERDSRDQIHHAVARAVENAVAALPPTPCDGNLRGNTDTAGAARGQAVGDDETSCISNGEVEVMINASLSLYSADKIGRPDFALQSAGSAIVHELTSPTYRPAELSWPRKIRNWIRPYMRPPEAVIDPDVTIGNCWACTPDDCAVTVRFASAVSVSAISVEHISPLVAYHMESAPRDLRVYGFESDIKNDLRYKLGEFVYLKNGGSVQTFELEASSKRLQAVTFEFLNNHGHTNYTCVYRVRVHPN